MGNYFQSCWNRSGQSVDNPSTNVPCTSPPLEDVPTNSSLAQHSNSGIDPKSLLFVQENNQLLVRKAGTIRGHDFIIEECDNCQIYILDVTAQVTIDGCTNCCIFLSPCESSVSIRNCANCEVITICSQLRLRDCKNVDVMLCCSSSPAIETSTDINFFGYQFAYFNLLKQMEDSKLSVFNNSWFKIHDFDQESPSQFEVKNNSVTTRVVFPFIFSFILKDSMPEQIREDLQPTEEFIIPLSTGAIWEKGGDSEILHPECLIFIISDSEEIALTAYNEVISKMDRTSSVVETKLIKCDHDALKVTPFKEEELESKCCVVIHALTASSVWDDIDKVTIAHSQVKVIGDGNDKGIDLDDIKGGVFGHIVDIPSSQLVK